MARGRPSEAGASFEDEVIAVLRSLESGEVVTYGEVAAEAGWPGAARAVGRTLATTEVEVPWWRVVTASGGLVPGLEEDHAERLAGEGVEVRDGRVVRRASRAPGTTGPGSIERR